MTKIPAIIYGLIGAGGVLLGIAAFIVLERGEDHAILEVASAAIAIGALSLLCAANFEQSQPWRYVVMLFFALTMIVHWWEFFRGVLPLVSSLYNSLPLAVTVVAEIIFWKHNRRTSVVGRSHDRHT